MKKIFLLSILLFQLTFVFGQEVTYAWGPWVQNPCFKGLQSRCKVKDYNSSAKQYTWDIEIKNNYSSKVSFNFDIQNSSIDGRTSINPGGIDKGWTLNPSSTNLYVEFSKVCFDPNDYCSINSNGTQNKGYKCHAECDNGIPNVPKLCGNTNSLSNSTNQQTTQQNDLSEYNRSKADLERQLAEKNAEITRQNEENARKGQIWNNAIKAGVDAHNSGNYTEAKNQFTIAINNSSNETNRQNAQNYYDKANEKSKSNENFKKTSEVTLQTLGLIDNLLEANKNAKKINSQQMKSNPLKVLDALSYDVITTFENAGFKFKKLSLEKIDEQKDYSYRMLIFENFQITLSTSEYVRAVTIESIQLIKDRDADNNELGFKNVFEEILKKEPYKKYNNKKNKIEIIKEPFSKIEIQIFNLDFTKLTKNYNNEFDKYKNYNLSDKNDNSFTINIEYQPTEDEIKENEKFQKKKYNAEIEKYKALANKGDEDAIYEIAGLFRHLTEDLEWDDIDENYILSKYWYLKYAAISKSGTAEYQIGMLYLKGSSNFPKDELLAKKWLTKSCNLGAKFACDKLEKLK